MVESWISKTAVKATLAAMVLELTYINSKSLLFLAGESSLIDQIFSVIGAGAFSSVTVVVMRKSDSKWLKLAFPAFDTALVFCGFNLKYADQILNHTDNPIRFYQTIFMALFTGLITYSIGKIRREEHNNNSLTQIESNSSDLNHGDSQVGELVEKNQGVSLPADLVANLIRYDSMLARKKLDSNRNSHDSNVLELLNIIKQGKEVSFEDYIRSRNRADGTTCRIGA